MKTVKELQDRAYDIIEKVDIKKLASGLDNVELAYVLSVVDNILTVKSQQYIEKRKEES
jgi:hypothetical protein